MRRKSENKGSNGWQYWLWVTGPEYYLDGCDGELDPLDFENFYFAGTSVK